MFSFALPRLLGFASFAPPARDAGGAGRRRVSPKAVDAVPVQETVRTPAFIEGRPQSELLDHLRACDADLAQRAVESLYRAFFPWLWRAAHRLLGSRDVAEEVVHDVFLQLWAHRREVVVRGDIAVYLYVAVRNGAHKQLRHERVVHRHAEATESAPDVAPAAFMAGALNDPDGVLAEHEAGRALLDALAQASARDRDILLLRWRDGWSYEEIAQALGMSSVAARVAVSRLQRRLRPVLERLRRRLEE